MVIRTSDLKSRKSRPSRPSKTSEKSKSGSENEEEDMMPPVDRPFNTGLDDDLETILETDQESNYMTTARTDQKPAETKRLSKKSDIVHNQSLVQPSDPDVLCQSMMDRSLNNSSFMLNDNNLP